MSCQTALPFAQRAFPRHCSDDSDDSDNSGEADGSDVEACDDDECAVARSQLEYEAAVIASLQPHPHVVGLLPPPAEAAFPSMVPLSIKCASAACTAGRVPSTAATVPLLVLERARCFPSRFGAAVGVLTVPDAVLVLRDLFRALAHIHSRQPAAVHSGMNSKEMRQKEQDCDSWSTSAPNTIAVTSLVEVRHGL